MKLLIASDIHGSAYFTRELCKICDAEKPDKLLLLGDILYHGPRNDLPREYNPKEVFALLNERKNDIVCVRGNCDSEVDQMVLEFPIMADYTSIFVDGLTLFATHGHVFSEQQLPPISGNFVLLHGHTHVRVAEKREGYALVNPSSVSLPKDGVSSFVIYENRTFTHRGFNGNSLGEFSV